MEITSKRFFFQRCSVMIFFKIAAALQLRSLTVTLLMLEEHDTQTHNPAKQTIQTFRSLQLLILKVKQTLNFPRSSMNFNIMLSSVIYMGSIFPPPY